MSESQLIQSIKRYLATLQECFFWKEHGGQYGTAGLPDIIVCANDFMALGVVNLFAECGISVPDDVMVAGFDDCMFSVTSPVPLTTVRQDLHTMAIRTAELLLRMIDDPNVREDVRIPTELIIRKSTQKKEKQA